MKHCACGQAAVCFDTETKVIYCADHAPGPIVPMTKEESINAIIGAWVAGHVEFAGDGSFRLKP